MHMFHEIRSNLIARPDTEIGGLENAPPVYRMYKMSEVLTQTTAAIGEEEGRLSGRSHIATKQGTPVDMNQGFSYRCKTTVRKERRNKLARQSRVGHKVKRQSRVVGYKHSVREVHLTG